MKKTRRKSKVLLGVGLILLFTFIPISSLVAQRCVQPPEGLVSWWDADAVSGTTASDIQDGNDGTLMNGATTAPGKVGDAFSFDGLDDYVETPRCSNSLHPLRFQSMVGSVSMLSMNKNLSPFWLNGVLLTVNLVMV